MGLLGETFRWLADSAHWTGSSGIPARVGEHLGLTLVALLIASAIALPVGLWVGHTRRGERLAVNAANLGRAVPSLAVIGIVVPITAAIDPQLGFRFYPTLLAMVALGMPPILVNAYAGVSEVDRDLTEAARGMGFKERQILAGVEVPLALPVIVAGIGSAAVQIIATATLGAIFGFGGLGTYLTEGIAQNDDAKVWAGVVLVAALALGAEGLFATASRRLARRGPAPAAGMVRPLPAPAGD